MALLQGTVGNDSLLGTTADDEIFGAAGNDTLRGGGGFDSIFGGGGNDLIFLTITGALQHGLEYSAFGGDGNDVITVNRTGYGQTHAWGGSGDDRIIMNLAGPQGTGTPAIHVYGGEGADRFEFTNTATAAGITFSRIDDFDASQDSIYVNGQLLNLSALPSGMRVVNYVGQQFLLVDQTVIALEGARLAVEFSDFGKSGLEELHFWTNSSTSSGFPDIFSAATTAFVDPVNFVPYSTYSAVDASLNRLNDYGTITGSVGSDYIWAWNSNITSDSISGGNGNDVIDANVGRDTVSGGDGNDLIAGGIDRDTLAGDAGADRVWGGSQNDSVTGGVGDDSLNGGTGNDILRGGNEADVVQGNSDADLLFGDAGNDRLFGGNGADFLRGGAGADEMTGGAEGDTFAFATGEMVTWGSTVGTTDDRFLQLDIVNDFVVGQDKLRFINQPGVASVADLTIWKVTISGNAYFAVATPVGGERILVDVADNVSYADFATTGNFLFG
jgi:Ca2+-binding RTX toxin-like protein